MCMRVLKIQLWEGGGMDEDFFSIRIQLKGLDHELQILPNTVINMLKYKIISENVKRERERERELCSRSNLNSLKNSNVS